MTTLASICVYCGSSNGARPSYVARPHEALGAAMAREGVRLVYGGGDVGLMGTVARAVIEQWRPRHRHHPAISCSGASAC